METVPPNNNIVTTYILLRLIEQETIFPSTYIFTSHSSLLLFGAVPGRSINQTNSLHKISRQEGVR